MDFYVNQRTVTLLKTLVKCLKQFICVPFNPSQPHVFRSPQWWPGLHGLWEALCLVPSVCVVSLWFPAPEPLILCHKQSRNLLSTHACTDQKLMSHLCPCGWGVGNIFPKRNTYKMLFHKMQVLVPFAPCGGELENTNLYQLWHLLRFIPPSI